MPVRVQHEDFGDIHEWNDYLDDIMGSCHIDSACIYGPGCKQLARSGSGAYLTESEYGLLRNTLAEFEYAKQISVGGKQYRVLLNDGRRGLLATDVDGRGLTVCKTRLLVIVGLHRPHAGDEECSKAVMALGDVMFTKGF